MSKVSWDTKYSIHIDDIDASVAYHLRKAIKKYLGGMDSGGDEVITSFEQIIDVCETIDERD